MAQANCPICGGTGWKIVEGDAVLDPAKVRVPVEAAATAEAAEEKAFVWRKEKGAAQGAPRVAVLCDCGVGDRTARVLARARVPGRYEHCDFENFETDVYDAEPNAAAWNRSLEQARLVVEGFARDFPLATDTGLLLVGSCGVGKTHLAVAALKQLVLRGHEGLFYDYRELLKEIQASYNPESPSTEMAVLEPVLKTEILLLDDLGASKPSPWALDMVGHILNVRYNEKRVTLLTTNYLDRAAGPDSAPSSPPESAAASRASRGDSPRLPSGQAALLSDDSLSDRVGHRIRSRLYEMCRSVEMFAPDYRREVRRAGSS